MQGMGAFPVKPFSKKGDTRKPLLFYQPVTQRAVTSSRRLALMLSGSGT